MTIPLMSTISNCVLNLVPDKDQAFREIHRVLKPGGRLAVSDMAWEAEPPASLRKDMEALVGCIGGALVLDDYVSRLKRAGFARVEVEKHAEAARKMVEVSGAVPPPGIEHLAQRQHHGHQMRRNLPMSSFAHRGSGFGGWPGTGQRRGAARAGTLAGPAVRDGRCRRSRERSAGQGGVVQGSRQGGGADTVGTGGIHGT